jgi:D-threo-aldose 1-dehydrogenase
MNQHGSANEAEVHSILEAAVALGVDLFDTAPLYQNGTVRSEERLSQLATLAPDAFIATKVGLYAGPRGTECRYDETSIRRSVEQSLGYLRRDAVDLVQLHELSCERWEAAFKTRGALAGLEQLLEDGLTKAIGVTGSEVQTLRAAVETGRFQTVQIWRRWNLLDRSAEPLLAAAHTHGVDVLVGGPFASGILASAPGAAWGELHYEPAPEAALENVSALKYALGKAGIPLATAALSFCLDERVSAVLTGVDSVSQILANARAVTADVDRARLLQIIESLPVLT